MDIHDLLRYGAYYRQNAQRPRYIPAAWSFPSSFCRYIYVGGAETVYLFLPAE